MIDQFTKDNFETYLKTNHQTYYPLGLIDGEECYNIALDNQASVTIRSSIKSNGLSADVGKDSIRCWLVDINSNPLGSKVSKWTTRQPNWQKRLDKNILQLLRWRMLAGDCPECDGPKGIFKAKTEKNKGRPFAKCVECDSGFVWLDKDIEVDNVYFTEESHDNGKNTNGFWEDEKVASSGSADKQENIMSEDCANGDNNITDGAHGPSLDVNLLALPKGPNEAQQNAIEADLNTDLLVLAGPGAGKTYIICDRCKYLVDNGIAPKNILVVTFGKAAADEMGKRILAICPSIILDQVSTIHALCYRLLVKWYPDSKQYGWKMPKDWEVKKTLEDAIGIIWQEKEKPNSQEVYDAINISKYLSLTADDSYQYFADYFGRDYGEWLYEIRSKLDAWLSRSRFLTFADMLYLVEKRLQSDKVWRDMLQDKFQQVIIDESQDTTFQAIRILITLSLKSGMNTVYEGLENE